MPYATPTNLPQSQTPTPRKDQPSRDTNKPAPLKPIFSDWAMI